MYLFQLSNGRIYCTKLCAYRRYTHQWPLWVIHGIMHGVDLLPIPGLKPECVHGETEVLDGVNGGGVCVGGGGEILVLTNWAWSITSKALSIF